MGLTAIKNKGSLKDTNSQVCYRSADRPISATVGLQHSD